MPVTTPTLAAFLAYWLRETVEPNLAPKTYEKYDAQRAQAPGQAPRWLALLYFGVVRAMKKAGPMIGTGR